MASDFLALIEWLPEWARAIVILGGAALAALYLHSLSLKLLRRSPAGRSRFLRLFLARTEGPSRLAVVLLVVTPILPLVGLPGALARAQVSIVSAIFILFLGWSGIAAIGLIGDLYLERGGGGFEDVRRRRQVTQIRLLHRTFKVLIAIIAIGGAMMTFPDVRQYGVSLFASAGAAGIVVGLAARPVLSNILAGIQIAITQPIKIEDSVVVNGEWGWVEDITSTYVVIRTWDLRRLIVPLAWILDRPIENWTRESTSLIGTVLFYVDYRAPVEPLRQELDRIVHASPLWDGQVVSLQVVDANPNAIQIRALASASDASKCWDLRCEVREKLIAFLGANYPEMLPQRRNNAISQEKSSP